MFQEYCSIVDLPKPSFAGSAQVTVHGEDIRHYEVFQGHKGGSRLMHQGAGEAWTRSGPGWVAPNEGTPQVIMLYCKSMSLSGTVDYLCVRCGAWDVACLGGRLICLQDVMLWHDDLLISLGGLVSARSAGQNDRCVRMVACMRVRV
jgi:hypothetical protein